MKSKAKRSKKVNAEVATPKRKRTGAAKHKAQKRVGMQAVQQPIDAATPAKSQAIQLANGRAAIAGGRTQRAEPEANVQAFKAIKSCYTERAAAMKERGLTNNAVLGAELNRDRLGTVLEEEALSATPPVSSTVADGARLVIRRRDSIGRIASGPTHAALRAKFGIHQPVRTDSPSTVRIGAEKLLAGKKAAPHSRAAALITSDDVKKLHALIKAIVAESSAGKVQRTEGTSRTTERDILNVSLELFYDDFAATVGLALEDDELARLNALNLVPRRTEQRTKKATKPAGDGSTESSAGSSTQSGSSSQVAAPPGGAGGNGETAG